MGSGSTKSESISAWSLRTGLTWLPDWGKRHPSLFFEYLYGSGDPDRRSALATVFGNKPGTTDNGFIPFGFVQTGYAFFPRLANLHILRLGGDVAPVPEIGIFKQLHVGLVGYAYLKDKASGGLSDDRASGRNAGVGQELDTYLNWRIFDDLAFNVRYGVFFPGTALPGINDPQHFLSVGMTLTY